MWFRSILAVILLVIMDKMCYVWSEKSFFIPFQSQSKGAYSVLTDECIEFENEIPKSQEITSCQWIRTKYFNVEPAFQLWSYCTVTHEKDAINCIELYLEHSEKSANRNVVMEVKLKYKTKVKMRVELKNFLHRTWVFLCFTASSITEEMKFYYNGNLVGTTLGVVKKNGTVLQSSAEMYDSALIFGQEADTINPSGFWLLMPCSFEVF